MIDRSHRLTADNYFNAPQEKKNIYLHHTVSQTFDSVWNWWNVDKNKCGGALKVATAYVIDTDGTVYEVFPPECWAYHLGLTSVDNERANKQSIGIEIVSEGALEMHSGILYWFDMKKAYRSRSHAYDHGSKWRGYQYFDEYDAPQIDALVSLVDELCLQFSIPKKLIDGDRNRFDLSLAQHNGILTHCNVRADKTDVHPGFPWERLE